MNDTPYRYTAALAERIELALAGPLGERGHVRRAEPGRPAGPTPRASPGATKLFVLDMFPYPSGAGLHVGHPLGYIATDVYARFQRMTRPATSCTRWASTRSACRPSSTPCRPASTRA